VWIEGPGSDGGQDAITVRLPAWALRVLEEHNGSVSPEDAAEELLLAAAKEIREGATR
jgi:hypothetical protein